MNTRKLQDLIVLIRRRYPDWADFSHPGFVADEIEYKQATIAKAQQLFSREVLDSLLAKGASDVIFENLQKLVRDNNMLWRNMPSKGDTAVLNDPNLDKPSFCTQIRNLLYGDRGSTERLQAFSDYLSGHGLPNKWPFATYLLFITHPTTEMLVKPYAASWFLKFMGAEETAVSSPTSAHTYAHILEITHSLCEYLQPYGAKNNVDVQSFIWVCFKESKQRVAGLNKKGQVDLNVPPNDYSIIDQEEEISNYTMVKETSSHEYSAQKNLETEREGTLSTFLGDIFQTRGNAEAIFDYLLKITRRLQSSGPNDNRFALTIPKPLSNRLMRLNFGNWMVFDIKNSKGTLQISANLIKELAEKHGFHNQAQKVTTDFAKLNENDPIVRVYHGLPFDIIFTDSFNHVFDQTLEFLGNLFRDWTRSPYRSAHQQVIFSAIFDKGLREHIIETDQWKLDHVASSINDDVAVLKEKEVPLNNRYDLSQVSKKTGYAQTKLEQWCHALQRKGQSIFFGPPGTGKTFIAQELARHLIGGGDGFWELVQFHPAYAYEDFMQGIRPLTQLDGSLRYEMIPGRFLNFCQRAKERKDSCVLIIDEINRAHIAAVFGELMYGLEYRETAVPLAGGGSLSIPSNVLIIGTMNTADRSIALVDHALRRRFAFIHMPPSNAILRHFHAQTAFPIEKLIPLLARLNGQINDPHYEIGHSFFLDKHLAQTLPNIWQMEIEPYLEEYFFDQTDQVDAFRWEKIKDQILR